MKNSEKLKIFVFSLFPVDGQMKTGGQARLQAFLAELYKSSASVHHVCIFGHHPSIRQRTILGGITETWIPAQNREKISYLKENFNSYSDDAISGAFLEQNEHFIQFIKNQIPLDSKLVATHFWFAKPIIKNLNKQMIYFSHNFESDFLSKKNQSSDFINYYKNQEKQNCQQFEHIFCCSKSDANKFAKVVAKEKISISRNGSNLKYSFFEKNKHQLNRECLFIGSHWGPNVEGLLNLLENNKHFCKNVKINCIGSVKKSFVDYSNDHITFYGILNPQQIYEIVQRCSFAINPVLSGGGSNVKNADYLALGLPILSTDFGAKGFEEFDDYIITEKIKNWNNNFKFVYPERTFADKLNWKNSLDDIISYVLTSNTKI